MDLLAITLLGFKFSGTLALVVAAVVVVVLGLLWFAWTRQRRRSLRACSRIRRPGWPAERRGWDRSGA
jgi:hypothetical protein